MPSRELMWRASPEGCPTKNGQEDYRSSKQALTFKLQDTLGRRGAFDDYKHTDMQELLRPGRCSVLQVGGMDRRSQQIVVATILRRAFEGRQQTKRGEIDPRDELHLPFPIFVLIEEAHRFAPPGGGAATSNLLAEILAEGRKFGMGIGLITQRPGKLDQDVLSQCMTQCIMRIVNPVDQNAVASAVESMGRDLLAELPALSKGQAIVSGAAVNTTVLCRVRERKTPHGGASYKSAETWTDYFQARKGPSPQDGRSALSPARRLSRGRSGAGVIRRRLDCGPAAYPNGCRRPLPRFPGFLVRRRCLGFIVFDCTVDLADVAHESELILRFLLLLDSFVLDPCHHLVRIVQNLNALRAGY